MESKKYICDDRNVLENLEKIRNMSDEEFKKYVDSEKNGEKKMIDEVKMG